MRHLLRRAVIQFVRRTAYFPFFYPLYRGYYRLSTYALVSSLRRLPEVQSVFANRSYPGEGWMPGYSDIDVVVTIKAMEPDVEVVALRKAWKRINRIRRFFPLITTVHLMTPQELDKWIRVGKLRRYEISQWTTLLQKCGR